MSFAPRHSPLIGGLEIGTISRPADREICATIFGFPLGIRVFGCFVIRHSTFSVRLKLTIAYDGRLFGGWQIQPNAVTIQAELERALAEVA